MTTSKPLIGILAAQTSSGLDIIERTATTYWEAVEQAGGLPVILPNSQQAWPEYLALVSGVVLIGGTADIDPSLYGEANTHSKDPNLAKDRLEIEIINRCLKTKQPLLAICRGMQLLNIACGGTLQQDLQTGFDHNQYERQNETVHDLIVKGSRLIADGTYAVNTIHHQGIGTLGQCLLAVGHSPDGIIEMIEHAEAPTIGVQWHPECLPQDSLTTALFGWLVAQARPPV